MPSSFDASRCDPGVNRQQVNRRNLIRSVASAGIAAWSVRTAFGASDFWNKKPSSDWSVTEVETLTTKSPWAKKVRGEIAGGAGGRGGSGGGDSMDRSGSRGTFGGMTGADSNGISNGGGGGGRGGRGGGGGGMDSPTGAGAPQGPEVIVRWENAKPVAEALKLQFPPDLDSHYAISVTGLPPQMIVMALNGRGRGRDGEPAPDAAPEDPAARQKAMVERLMHSATLSAKGHEPEVADMVRQSADKQSLIFGFQKQNLPLAASDKDVQFVLKLGRLTVKAKFEPKEMMYKGEMAV